jgi:predicted unusual protein kinase regulating ubiquinone biosynthesis (AarF/ABC1/UbiB family)
VLDRFDAEPVAVRPAAQIHRGAFEGEEVAVRVRRPGVERAVRNDLALLDVLTAPLRAAFPALDAGAMLRDARELALDELDFEHEASTQRRLARALRGVPGVSVPRPVSELASAEVLVATWAPGTTLAAGARPDDPDATARSLVAGFRAAVLEGGLAPVDPRASHVVVDGPDVALLGMGVARPVDRVRAQLAVDAFAAVADDDPAGFADALARMDLLPADRAEEAHAVARRVLGPVLDGPALLDAAALRDLFARAAADAGPLIGLAVAASPRPEDVSLARSLAQLLSVVARLGVTEDWAALIAGR